jgi:hypothetical protein
MLRSDAISVEENMRSDGDGLLLCCVVQSQVEEYDEVTFRSGMLREAKEHDGLPAESLTQRRQRW